MRSTEFKYLTINTSKEIKTIKIEVERKRRKQLVLKVCPKTSSVFLSLPLGTPDGHVEKFITYHKDWLVKQLEKINIKKSRKTLLDRSIIYFFGSPFELNIRRGLQNRAFFSEDKIILIEKKELDELKRLGLIEKLFLEKSHTIIDEIVRRLSRKYFSCLGLRETPIIKMRKMTAKWGVCRPYKNRITLNKKLINLSIELIEYVVVHELCHFKCMNHSKAFYSLLEQCMPDWKERRKKLNSSEEYITIF